MINNQHYLAVKEFYGERCAQRSGVKLINHIDEGLLVLNEINASLNAKEAFCIHPLLQQNNDLLLSLEKGSIFNKYNLDTISIVLAMEYRSVANSYLSIHCKTSKDKFNISKVKCVNDMLIADKVQNRKDFEIYHLGKHEKGDTLQLYFSNWFSALGITEARYQHFIAILSGNI